MEKRIYSEKVDKSLSEIKSKLEQAQIEGLFFKQINEGGQYYKNAQSRIIKNQIELECLSQFTSLPEILYFKYASNDRIRELLEEKIQSITERINKLNESIKTDEDNINALLKEQKELADEYSDLQKDSDSSPEKAATVQTLFSKAHNLDNTIKEYENIKAKKEKDLEGLKYFYNEIVDMSDDEYRNFIINGIEGSEKLLKRIEHIKANKENYKIFARASKSASRLNKFTELLTKLHIASLIKPDPVFYEKKSDLIGKTPVRLLDTVYSNTKIYNPATGELVDPAAVCEAIKEYYSTYTEQLKTYKDIRRDLDCSGKEIAALYKYEKACKEANVDEIVYGNPNNTDKQNEVLEFFTKNHMERLLELCNDGFNNHEAEIIDYKFYVYNNKKFFRKKRKIEFMRSLVKEQIEIIRQKRDYLKEKQDTITHLPIVDLIDSDANNTKFLTNMDNTVNSLHEKLGELIKTFEGLVNEYNRNAEKQKNNVLGIVNEILKLTSCGEYDLSLLINKETGDDLVTKIYQNAALYDAALLIYDLEEEAKQVSLSEEAKLNGMTVEEFAVRRLSEQREMYLKMLEDQRVNYLNTKNNKTSNDSTDGKPAQVKTLKSKSDYLNGLYAYINEDIDD